MIIQFLIKKNQPISNIHPIAWLGKSISETITVIWNKETCVTLMGLRLLLPDEITCLDANFLSNCSGGGMSIFMDFN